LIVFQVIELTLAELLSGFAAGYIARGRPILIGMLNVLSAPVLAGIIFVASLLFFALFSREASAGMAVLFFVAFLTSVGLEHPLWLILAALIMFLCSILGAKVGVTRTAGQYR
ncbi:hypothetical protein JQN09_24710, partial [Phocaeicola dorei]|uniref:hypothetical protein n=1 Tax=Phocaeicola dorei TaxID=357276 RepID=UPI001BDECD72